MATAEVRIIGVIRLSNKKENRLYRWSRLVQAHDQLIKRLLSNANSHIPLG